MLSAEQNAMANLDWEAGFAMPVADSNNKQLEKQVRNKMNWTRKGVSSISILIIYIEYEGSSPFSHLSHPTKG